VTNLASTDLTGSSLQFYWIDAGNSRSITYTYVMTNLSSASATVTFNVDGPSGLTVTTPYLAAVRIMPTNLLELGDKDPNDPSNYGIVIQASATHYPSSQGRFRWVQLIIQDRLGYRDTGGPHSCVPNGFVTAPGVPELDVAYPYSPDGDMNSSSYTDDSPKAGLSDMQGEVARDFRARMYLMWISTLTNAIPVPLGYVNWQFAGDAINTLSLAQGENGTTWILPYYPKSADSFVASQTSTSFPLWQTAISASETLGARDTCLP
jgi:hypothetical protein